MIAEFPRVDLPGNEVTDDQRSTMDAINELHEGWHGLKVNAAMALMRTGQTVHVKPPFADVAKRLAKNKAGRRQRRVNALRNHRKGVR